MNKEVVFSKSYSFSVSSWDAAMAAAFDQLKHDASFVSVLGDEITAKPYVDRNDPTICIVDVEILREV